MRTTTILLLALALGACNASKPEPSPGAPELVRKLAPEAAGDSAMSAGVLTFTNGCLAMEHADGSRTLLLWPAEARLARAPDGALRVLGTPGKAQQTVKVGEEIQVGGSELGGGSAQVGPGLRIPATTGFPAGCEGRVWNVYSFGPAPSKAASALPGEWTVAEVHGSPPEAGTPVVHVSITADRIRTQSQCMPHWWTYAVSGETIKATPEPVTSPACERTEPFWETAFAEAIGRATSVVAQPDGAILLSGPGGQVLLRPKP